MRACAALVCLSELLATAPAVPVPLGAPGARVADNASTPRRLAEGCDLRPSEVSRHYAGRALDYARAQPLEWIGLMGRKLRLFFP